MNALERERVTGQATWSMFRAAHPRRVVCMDVIDQDLRSPHGSMRSATVSRIDLGISDIAVAAGVGRVTLCRQFANRATLSGCGATYVLLAQLAQPTYKDCGAYGTRPAGVVHTARFDTKGANQRCMMW
jgi:hypothetical protein